MVGKDRAGKEEDRSHFMKCVGIAGVNKEIESGSLRGRFEVFVNPIDDPDIAGVPNFHDLGFIATDR